MKFHSGKALTSADVKRASSASPPPIAVGPQVAARRISKIDTPDDKTGRSSLKSRSISLPYNLSYVWIYGPGTSNYKTAEDGTGPYTLGTWKRGSSL